MSSLSPRPLPSFGYFTRFVGSGLVALSSALFLGCGTDATENRKDDTSIDGNDGQDPELIEPQVYLLSESEGFEPLSGTTVRLSLSDEELGFSAGCNRHLGTYEIADGTLLVDQFGSTKIGCGAELQQQDEWLATFLSSEPTITLSGDVLTISSSEATLTFVATSTTDSDRPLIGTSWHIDAQFEGEFATGGEGHEADLVFNDDSTFIIDGPCNTISGTFEHDEETITVGQSSMTDAACEDPVESHFELHLMALFSPGENTYSITTNRLRVARGDSGVYALSAN